MRERSEGFRDLSERNFIGGERRFKDIVPFAEPIFIANLTSRVGGYIVSVRRVNSYGCPFDANPAAASENASATTTGPITLSIQAMSATQGEDVSEIKSLADGLTVTDSAGNRLLPLASKEFQFPHGFGCILQLPSSFHNVHYLKSVDGHITGFPRQDGIMSLDFHLMNVPVPWYPHVFGLIGAMIGESKSGVTQIRGAEVETLLKSMSQTAFESSELKIPNRIVLAQDVFSSIRLPVEPSQRDSSLTSKAIYLRLLPHLTTDGEMLVKYNLSSVGYVSPLQQTIVWDNEPVLLRVPAKGLIEGASSKSQVLIYLHLYLQKIRPEKYYSSPTPWQLLAHKGERGGAVSGQVLTEKGSFGMGFADLRLARLSPEKQIMGKVQTMRMGLDNSGHFSISNLQAGQYQLTLKQVIPYKSDPVITRGFADYLIHKFGLQDPWLSNASQTIEVRAGERTEIENWTYRSRSKTYP